MARRGPADIGCQSPGEGIPAENFGAVFGFGHDAEAGRSSIAQLERQVHKALNGPYRLLEHELGKLVEGCDFRSEIRRFRRSRCEQAGHQEVTSRDRRI